MTEGICKAGRKGGLLDDRSSLVRYFFKLCDKRKSYIDSIQSDWQSWKWLSSSATADFEDILLLAWECQAPFICRDARNLGLHCWCLSVEYFSNHSDFTSHMKSYCPHCQGFRQRNFKMMWCVVTGQMAGLHVISSIQHHDVSWHAV